MTRKIAKGRIRWRAATSRDWSDRGSSAHNAVDGTCRFSRPAVQDDHLGQNGAARIAVSEPLRRFVAPAGVY